MLCSERNAVFLNLGHKTSKHSQLRFRRHRIENLYLDNRGQEGRRVQSAFLQKDSWLVCYSRWLVLPKDSKRENV